MTHYTALVFCFCVTTWHYFIPILVWAIKSDLNINWSEGVLFDVETGSSWSTAAAKVLGCCQQLQLLPSVCQKENWASRTGVGRTVEQGRKVGVRPSLVCAGCVLWHSIPEKPLPQPSRQSLNISLKYQSLWFFSPWIKFFFGATFHDFLWII